MQNQVPESQDQVLYVNNKLKSFNMDIKQIISPKVSLNLIPDEDNETRRKNYRSISQVQIDKPSPYRKQSYNEDDILQFSPGFKHIYEQQIIQHKNSIKNAGESILKKWDINESLFDQFLASEATTQSKKEKIKQESKNLGFEEFSQQNLQKSRCISVIGPISKLSPQQDSLDTFVYQQVGFKSPKQILEAQRQIECKQFVLPASPKVLKIKSNNQDVEQDRSQEQKRFQISPIKIKKTVAFQLDNPKYKSSMIKQDESEIQDNSKVLRSKFMKFRNRKEKDNN